MNIRKVLIFVEPFLINRTDDDFLWISLKLLDLASLLLKKGIKVILVCNKRITDNPEFSGKAHSLQKYDFKLAVSPSDVSEALTYKFNSDILAWKSLISEKDYSDCLNFQPFIRELSESFNPDIVFTWSHNVCVQKAITNVPVIHLELGMIRNPFPLLCYWDDKGVNGASSFHLKVVQWMEEISPDQKNEILNFFSNLHKAYNWLNNHFSLNVPLNDLIGLKNLMPYIVVFLQSEVDANTISFSRGHDVSTVLYLAKKISYDYKINVIVKPHPGNKFQYESFCAVNNIIYMENFRPAELLRFSAGSLSINSSTTIESILFGKPTLQLGDSPLSGLKISSLFFDMETFIEKIQLLRAEVIEHTQEEKLLLFLFMFAYQFPFEKMKDSKYLLNRMNLEILNAGNSIPFQELTPLINDGIKNIFEQLKQKWNYSC